MFALLRLSKRLWQACALLTLLLPIAHGQDQSVEPALLKVTRSWLDGAVATAQARTETPLRLEVEIGALDSRLRLAPCAQVEPYLPSGARLWGRTRVGLRCVDGRARWNVFLPVTIKAYGPAWVVRNDIASGTVLGEDDLMQAETDWAAEHSPVLVQADQWLGQMATRALGTGVVLRQNMVRAPNVFQAGTQVRVLAQGRGFQIAATGQAVTSGVLGQLAKVRMENGRIMSGVVLDARTVKLEM